MRELSYWCWTGPSAYSLECDVPTRASRAFVVLSPSSFRIREKYLKFGLLASATDQVISFSHILTLFASGYGTYLEARTRRSHSW